MDGIALFSARPHFTERITHQTRMPGGFFVVTIDELVRYIRYAFTGVHAFFEPNAYG
jgi:hypothetical protein